MATSDLLVSLGMAPELAKTIQDNILDLGAVGADIIVGTSGAGHDVTFHGDTAGQKLFWDQSADTLFLPATVDIDGTVTVGVDDTGYDVKFFSATAGKSWLWDESADKMIVTGTSSFLGAIDVGVDDAGHDVNFYGATAGKKFFWDESADTAFLTCTVDVDGTITVGVDDTGYDVKFFGATTGKSWLWDESADGVVLAGNETITGNLTVTGAVAIDGSIQNTNTTAVTAATGGSIPVLTFTDGLNLVSFTTNADDIVHLPTNVAGDVGKEIEIYAVQGFELRSADASATLNNVVIGATNECAFVAGTYAKLKCVADNTWLAVVSTLIDGTQTKLVPDAV